MKTHHYLIIFEGFIFLETRVDDEILKNFKIHIKINYDSFLPSEMNRML